MPTLTINIAATGTPEISSNGTGYSTAGHMWYSLNDGSGNPPVSYGFAPDQNHQGSPWTPHTEVSTIDDSVYQGPLYYTKTIDVTQAQYDALTNFGTDVQFAARLGQSSIDGFSTYYNVLTNSCIDFVWKALQSAGLNPAQYEGALLPSANAKPIDSLLNNIALQNLTTAGVGIVGATNNADGSITTQYSDGTASTIVINPVNGSYTISTAHNDGFTTVINYNANGNATSVTARTPNPADGTYTVTNADANGSCTSTTYNATNNQVISISSVDGQGSGSSAVYNPDNTSTQTNFSANGPTLSTTYDANMKEISSTVTQQNGSSTTDIYDTNGNTTFHSENDGHGNWKNTDTTYPDADPNTYNQTWIASDNSHGTFSQAADGSYTKVTYNPDGSSTVVSYNSSTGDYTYIGTDTDGNSTSTVENYRPDIPCAAVSPPVKQFILHDTDLDYPYEINDGVTDGEVIIIYIPPTDPLILDLNGNGIETVGVSAGILFDHQGNGVKQATGWVAPSDGFLVLDRNGNGMIDNGAELFGNSTPLYGATGNITGYAADGQSALAAQDTNGDGVVNNLDTNFANLSVWQDINQDGISQPDELQTLAQLGITGLYVPMPTANVFTNGSLLPNGNQLTATGAFIHADGTTGATADVNLALNPLAHSFADTIPVAAEAQALPTMQGSGTVRDLNQAASMQSPEGAALFADLTAFSQATTSFAQHAEIDGILQDWAATSTQQTSARLAAAQGSTLHYYTQTAYYTLTAPEDVDAAESARIADICNRRFAASRKATVGKTYVHQVLRRHDYGIKALRRINNELMQAMTPHISTTYSFGADTASRGYYSGGVLMEAANNAEWRMAA